MKIFLLEDDHNRIGYFSKEFIEDELVVVNAVNSAKEVLEHIFFDIIFLDHDLGGKIHVDSENRDTGYWVAKYLADCNNPNNSVPVIIHSYNPQGARSMRDILSSTLPPSFVQEDPVERQVFVAPFLSEEFLRIIKNIKETKK